MALMAEKSRVCVTGAGGYVASSLVKLLLSKDYIVHGTVRDPSDDKYAHLKNLDKAAENLKLFKADLLDPNSLAGAIKGCNGVFHVACPVPSGSVPNPEVELVEPAVNGTLNVLKACSEENIKRVVFVSSVAAASLDPNWPKGKVKDETCWSDSEYCKATNNWYCFSKTMAEKEAWSYAKKSGLDMVTVLPALVVGPMLQKTTNASSLALIKLLKEGYKELENKKRFLVDVRDVAEALLLVYERPEAEGRYLCAAHTVKSEDLVAMLKKHYPNYNYPKCFTDMTEDTNFSSEKLQKLGWQYRPLEETLVDAVESYKQKGFLD
ncbi:cinnamoyl-CoA reductase 1-like [Solanum verrucosum]|uniref:cinnamoyl-CoA reductase 1-like n=1 Tax=Solanum verrucosum TaxID=315347 RepID=UPI0020D1F1D9|nr:cinnamoyl-CoA reductase 1-like [Solanum verrucosum]